MTEPRTDHEDEPGSRRFRDLIARERQDMAWLVRTVAVMFDEVSGGRISKPMTLPHHVMEAFAERLTEQYNEGYEEGKRDAIEAEAALPVPALDPLREAAQALSDVANEPYTVVDKTWPFRYDAARTALRAALREGETK